MSRIAKKKILAKRLVFSWHHGVVEGFLLVVPIEASLPRYSPRPFLLASFEKIRRSEAGSRRRQISGQRWEASDGRPDIGGEEAGQEHATMEESTEW